MDQEKLHIIVTGEHGQGRAFTVCKKTACRTAIFIGVISVVLCIASLAGIKLYRQNLILSYQNTLLDAQLAETMSVLDESQANRTNLVVRYEKNIASLVQEHESLLENSITRLDEKSKVIEKVMDHLGVEVKIEEDPNHSGGPFLYRDEGYGDQLIVKAERYLEVLNSIPLGRPVPGKISSKYGSRIDPMKNRKAFHPGIDFRGNTGDEVKATADAVVKTASANSTLGKYIILSHGNGFETTFAHLHKRLVKKGDTVTRGQVIGLIGNTGRSTGSHLHYGVSYNKKSIDPLKYLQVAGLSLSVTQ